MTTAVYRFGGKGNDWCFVRTPDDYERVGRPYPFVICNHGNGWVMDGSSEKAGFTGMNASPLIEAMINAGYIVCGAQNFGDLLFGNEDSTQACVDFYWHMIRSYHVESACFMLGVSAGFLTTLNAARRLGLEKVLGIIGLYPLCSLQHAYQVTHRAQLKMAYHIDSDDQFVDKTESYDPFRVKAEYPPMKVWWSSTDQVLPMEEHVGKWVLTISRELRGYIEHVQVDRDGSVCEHGHPRHFDGAGCVEWLERCRQKKRGCR